MRQSARSDQMDANPGKERKRQADRRAGSMSLILDCAEGEFADNGYDGTTLAGVAKVAGVDSALMRYYFGDKRNLFASVIRRRAPASNALRQRAMAAYREAHGDAMSLEGIIEAFTLSSFELLASDQGWRNYGAIIAYLNSAHGFMRDLMSEVFDEVSHDMINDLRRVLPKASDDNIFWAYHFITGAYTFSLGQTERIDVLSNDAVSSRDFAAIGRRLPIVLAAGIRAMCDLGGEIDHRSFKTLSADDLSTIMDVP